MSHSLLSSVDKPIKRRVRLGLWVGLAITTSVAVLVGIFILGTSQDARVAEQKQIAAVSASASLQVQASAARDTASLLADDNAQARAALAAFLSVCHRPAGKIPAGFIGPCAAASSVVNAPAVTLTNAQGEKTVIVAQPAVTVTEPRSYQALVTVTVQPAPAVVTEQGTLTTRAPVTSVVTVQLTRDAPAPVTVTLAVTGPGAPAETFTQVATVTPAPVRTTISATETQTQVDVDTQTVSVRETVTEGGTTLIQTVPVTLTETETAVETATITETVLEPSS